MASKKIDKVWISELAAELPPLLPLVRASELLCTSERTVRRLIATGRLEALRYADSGSSRVIVPRAAIIKYLQSLTP